MITVSQGFLNAIAAPSRMTRARVRLEVLDNDAWIDNTKSATSQAVISRLEQVTNRVRDTPGAYATFEPGRWKLDGSCVIPPAPDELPDTEVGWWSAAICDLDGLFSPAEGVSLVCGALYNAAGLTIAFDPAAGEYAVDFTVTVYGADDVLVHEETVTGNDHPRYRIEHNLLQLQRLELSISRWSHGQRRAKVLEIDFGLVEDYGEDSLIDLSLITELDSTSGTLPIGELRFRLDNSDKRFDILNPQGLYYFLQRRQLVTTEFGVDVGGRIEYAPGGTYYLTEWKSDTGTLTASFTARNLLDLLREGRYRKGVVQTTTAYALAESILQDGGVEDYSIDPALQNIQLSACVPIVSYRDALQLVAMAGRAVVRIDTAGRVIIEQLTYTAPVTTIDQDNAWSAPEITLDKLITAVNVEVTGHRLRSNAEVYNGTVNLSGAAEIWLEYSNPCQAHQVTVTDGTLDSAEHYAYASRLVVTGAGNVQISVTADEMEQTKSIYTLQDDTRPAYEQPQTLQVHNQLINSPELAADVAAWLLAESRRRLIYDVDWRQNPALEIADMVTIEDEFGGNRPARIIRHELNYAGYISGRTRAKGGGS